MIFDKEQWHIARDTEARTYCDVVDNRVRVYPGCDRKKEYSAFIKVPSDFFHMLNTLGKHPVEELRARPVFFILEQWNDRLWYFSYVVNGTTVDLWVYKDLPGWAMRL